jgi:hypothetical protein
MTEHYTRNTLECTAWCARCQRMTQHRVDGGRKGPCIDPKHLKPPVKAVIPPFDDVEKSKQGKLFEK